jgi:hypothetical protein
MVDLEADAELEQAEAVEAQVGQGEPLGLRAQQRFEILQAVRGWLMEPSTASTTVTRSVVAGALTGEGATDPSRGSSTGTAEAIQGETPLPPSPVNPPPTLGERQEMVTVPSPPMTLPTLGERAGSPDPPSPGRVEALGVQAEAGAARSRSWNPNRP